MRVHTQCTVAGLLGLVLGLAAVAHGQEPPHVQVVAGGGWVEAAKALGLPGVLAGLGTGLGYLLRGGGIPITATVQLHPDDRELLKRIARHLASAVEDPPTDPGRPRRALDSEGL